MLQLSGNKPIPGVLFGITHETDGSLLLREAKILKVGIGLPRGRALNVWINNDKKWCFRAGNVNADKKLEFKTVAKLDTKQQAEAFYAENYAKADVCGYPRKLGFFTFTHPVIGEDGAEVFEPDWDAIEACGPTPTEIDIVFLGDTPFSGAYQMWSASELRCKGDGVNALRVLSMAATDEEKTLAEEARRDGEKYFPIVGGCWTRGCPYRKETTDNRGRAVPSACKPGGDLTFQLARNIRVGGTAYFHTSGYRSISQIFSSVERIKTLTGGRLAGIPLKMVLRPYRTKHNGQAATQYGVSLEFRAEDVESLRKNLMEQAWKFRQVAEPVRRRFLDAPTDPVLEEDEDEIPVSAQAIVDEFYADGAEDAEEEPPAPVSTAAAATQTKAAELAKKLQRKTTKKPVEPEPEPEPQPQPTPPSSPAREPNPGDLF